MKEKLEVANTLKNIADFLDGKTSVKKTRLALTTIGSELGSEELVQGALMAVKENPLLEVVLIGPPGPEEFPQYNTDCEKEAHQILENLLETKEVEGAVTLHYNFPLGISTVGRVITPAKGKAMYIATTTGTTSANRVEAMVLNGILGIIAAKGAGIKKPTLGILNVEGSRQVERILTSLQKNGLDFQLAQSVRKDGGSVMRGNDLLNGSCDVMVCDTLTGNLLMKIFSSFTTGGNYETLGWGYGPGIGKNMKNIISIISRASGAPVVNGALQYTYQLVRNNLIEIAKKEFLAAEKAGLTKELDTLKTPQKLEEEIIAPPQKPVTAEITGIDILGLEDAVKVLWKEKIYAETGMGCAGPVIMVSPEDKEKGIKILKEHKYL
ncbi:glycine/sarcosine/betaine reductase complex component C subunit alpha [Anaerobranca gottschalkii]|uniref:Betaine reductase n=1 Tax=Anaerobranca gottschalkii DSM 13577 TaxID=1120990 RepID=A0A1I0CDV5_9FIRM|nr:glycine/sarcosine/betaine reductase complex component C subunit alpha [Anaerobranca gottschalkii]SET17558.1 betaine reductase [Anaerobranca gottschalkii DSM 13577]